MKCLATHCSKSPYLLLPTALILTVALSTLLAGEAQAAIVMTSAFRQVVAAATGVTDADFDESDEFGLFDESASAIGAPPGGATSANANQFSTTPDPSGPPSVISGSGDVSTLVTWGSIEGGFSFLADSVFNAAFEIDDATPQTYVLTATVHWTGDVPPFGGFSTVALFESGSLIADIETSAGDPGTATLVPTLITLLPGTSYEILAQSQISGGFASIGTFDGAGSWSFSLAPATAVVPEPASLVLLAGLGIGVAAVTGRRHRGRVTSRR
jgi:hypothetical protein